MVKIEASGNDVLRKNFVEYSCNTLCVYSPEKSEMLIPFFVYNSAYLLCECNSFFHLKQTGAPQTSMVIVKFMFLEVSRWLLLKTN